MLLKNKIVRYVKFQKNLPAYHREALRRRENKMKKRMLVYVSIFSICLFHILIPHVVFGQSAAQEVIKKYKELPQSLQEDIQPLIPTVLRAFDKPEIQAKLLPRHITSVLTNPFSLKSYDSKIDPLFMGLLGSNDKLRTFFASEQFYNVLKDSNEIAELLDWFETLPNTPPEFPQEDYQFNQVTDIDIAIGSDIGSVVATDADGDALTYTLTGNDAKHFAIDSQTGHITVGRRLTQAQPYTFHVVADDSKDKTNVAVTVTTGATSPQPPIKQSFAVRVVDQKNEPIPDIGVTFQGTKDGNTCEIEQTGKKINGAGQNQTTLTLGPSTDENCVLTATVSVPFPGDGGPRLPPMYWIEGNTIYYRSTGGEKTSFWTPTDGTLMGGLAVDTVGGKVYWTEEMSDGKGRVQSANLDGTRVGPGRKITAVPLNITVGADSSGKRWVYWTNSRGRIQRIEVGGSRVENFKKNVDDPKHIAFDVETRRLHWTDANGIWSIYTDNDTGTPRRLGMVDSGEVRGIAVYADVVYWTEQTNGSGSVRFMKRNGSGSKKLLASELLASLEEIIPGGIAVDAVGGKVYWTTSHGIRSAPLTGETVVISEEEPAGIALGGTTAAPGAPAAPSLSPAVSVEDTLLANYPNPFNPETWIPYQLSASADVSVSIYSVNGHLVRRLDLGHQSAGVYRSRSRAAYWDGRNAFGERVASGLYFYTLTAGDFTATRKMLIRK